MPGGKRSSGRHELRFLFAPVANAARAWVRIVHPPDRWQIALTGVYMNRSRWNMTGKEPAAADREDTRTRGSFSTTRPAGRNDAGRATLPAQSRAIVAWSAIARLPTRFGDFHIRAFRDVGQREHAVLYLGEMAGRTLVPVRVHSECLTSEVLGSLRCDCKTQLDMALAHIALQRVGMLIYLRQEGRGTGLVSKIDAYALQDTGLDTVEASGVLGVPVDARSYELAGDVIRLFGIASISLLTNNPEKIESLRRQGIVVARRVPMHCELNQFNGAYLRAKKSKLCHLS
jgi:GTP cyclohydrolase II